MTHGLAAPVPRVLALVRDMVRQEAIRATIEPDTPLSDAGLTSMDMVNLMFAVESEFDFTIPQDDITPVTFASVAAIARMVGKHLPLAA